MNVLNRSNIKCEFCGNRHIKNDYKDCADGEHVEKQTVRSNKKCKFCDKVFNNKSNFNRHIKNVHKVYANGEHVEKQIFSCVLCDKSFSTKCNLQRHIEIIHSSHTDSSKLSKCNICNFKTYYVANLNRHLKQCNQLKVISTNKNLTCSLCDAKYKLKSSLKRHESKVHQVKKHGQIKKKCPICPFVTYQYGNSEMHTHLEKIHDIKLKWEEHNFSSITDFFKWKNEIEVLSTSSFIKRCGIKKNVQIYWCHRSESYKNNKELNKKHLKITKCCKIGAFCPSNMKMTMKDNDNINVLFLNTHVGHKNELKHKRLIEEERQPVAIQLAFKKPHTEILKDIRNSFLRSNSELQRIQLINKKDITNIEKSFNLGDEAMGQPFDPISISAWVETLKCSSNTSFVLYKPQGCIVDSMANLDSNDFVLIFMTTAQEEMLGRLGKDIICIDGTHGTNNYDLQLYTLLVMDETNEGFPVAFMISNKGDEKSITFFIKTIKEKVGQINPSIFMSDVEETFYKSWVKVMGPTRQLYCAWYVLRAWKENSRIKIKNKDKQNETVTMLKSLMYELDNTQFHTILDKALCDWNEDKEMTDFYEYFVRCYVGNDTFKKWAYYCRIHCGINTNMSMENFDRLLKYCYLKGKKTKRLDKTLCALLNLLRDKLFHLIVKNYKGKVLKKLLTLRKRHRESYKLIHNFVVKEAENKWHILSSQCMDIYIVHKIKKCTSCMLLCDHCNSCYHEYICSCMDSSIQSNMCKHIHLVAKLVKNEENALEREPPEDCPIDMDVPEVNTIVLREASCSLNEVEQSSFTELLNDFVNEINKALIENVTNMDELNYIKKHFAVLLPTLQAMKSSNKKTSAHS